MKLIYEVLFHCRRYQAHQTYRSFVSEWSRQPYVRNNQYYEDSL